MLNSIDTVFTALAAAPFFTYPLALLIGLVVGSFLNVVILRTPNIMEQTFREECCTFLEIAHDEGGERLSLSRPASTCPRCGTAIKPWHNIPVISYLWLRGRCAGCQTTISLRYPMIELVTGLLTVATVAYLGLSLATLVALCLLWTLIALTMIDIDTQLLPDQITLPLLWAGLIANYFGLYTNVGDALWGAIGGYMVFWLVFQVFQWITGKQGMGYGDFKLLAALGAWMGWQSLPLIILLSSFVGAFIGIAGIILLGRDKSTPIPFGPYLAIAGWVTFVWGEPLLAYYFQLMGI